MKPRQIAVALALSGLAGIVYLAAQPLRRSAQTVQCQNNLKQIGNSLSQYSRDYDEKFPLARNWMDALYPYAKGFGPNPESAGQVEARFRCPTSGSFYAYNRLLETQSLSQVSFATPRFWEVSAGHNRRNLSDDGSLWPQNPIHQTKTASGSNAYFDVYSASGQARLLSAKPRFGLFAKPKSQPQKSK